jgi:phage tail-like protein
MTDAGNIGERPSIYLQYLPAIYQDDHLERVPGFLGRFLLSFQQIITGTGDVALPGIEEILDGIPAKMAGIERYFEPGPDLAEEFRAPPDFLKWLSGWVAMNLRADYTIAQQRQFVAQAVSLYHWRGTKKGLNDYLRIYVGPDVGIDINDTPAPTTENTRAGRPSPYFFIVTLTMPGNAQPAAADVRPRRDSIEMARFRQVVEQIVDQQKPAHTYYRLDIEQNEQANDGRTS